MIVPIFHQRIVRKSERIFSSLGAETYHCAQSGCQECQNGLLQAHESLVHWVVQRQGWGGVAYADLVQEGRITLWRAILGYRPEAGSTFANYACQAIRHRVWQVTKLAQRGKVHWERPEEPETLAEVVAQWQAAQIQEALQEGLECLSERQRYVVEQVYGLSGAAPRLLVELGAELGVSGERVRQIRTEALQLLRLPALSLRLRSLCERDSREEYRRARQMNDACLRRGRGMK